MSVTIKDVAKAANVSVASVSRVLNGRDNVNEETRKRILAAVRRLRYMPNCAARSLITRRTHTLGALLPDLHGEFFSELIRGIDIAARARGLHLLVSSSHGDADEAAAALRTMRGKVDGLLVMSPYANADFLADNLPPALPTVLINTPHTPENCMAMSVDNHAGAYAMVEHLASLGHRHIAFISGPEDNFEAQNRLHGYRDAMAALLPGVPVQILEGEFTDNSGYLAGQHLLQLEQRPDAVFAANDMMAIGCLSALHEAGLRVPEDIALAGFDDIPLARYITPKLTTVRVHIAELGEQALARLVQAIEEPNTDAEREKTLQSELVLRASSGTGAHETRRKTAHASKV
jgi:LacI family transcriptional regulator